MRRKRSYEERFRKKGGKEEVKILKKSECYIDRQTHGQRNRQTHRQTDRQTDT